MKIKYFLRGLGMGIVFTVLLLLAVGGTKKEMLTDEEIMARASLLGMVRAEIEPEETEAPETEAPETEAPETEPPETKNPAPSESPEKTEKPEKTQNPKEPEYVTVTIKGGMSSIAVARALEAAGLVSSAEEFDKYLCKNGDDFAIAVGTFKIREGADFEEIAEKITN